MTAAVGDARPPASRLAVSDLLRVASVGIRTRRLRAGLAALGIAIGVGAIVAVLGLAASSRAGLLDQIDRLGTNLLVVSSGETLFGEPAELPTEAPSMIRRIDAVSDVEHTATVDARVYRSPLVPEVNTNGLAVRAASLDLPDALRIDVADGRYLDDASATLPVAVLGSSAAARLGITNVFEGARVWLGDQWFGVVGILEPAELSPSVDASVLVGYPVAEAELGHDGRPSTVYVRAATSQVGAVRDRLAASANPLAPAEVAVSRPSDALVARADAERALDGLFLGLGVICLVVGAVGVANVMIISVLERRSEIGLRRALGATKGAIRAQFFVEAILLSVIGGASGTALGAAATMLHAITEGWAVVIPPLAWAGGLGSALLIGAVAGLVPALRAARMSPTQALWAV